MAARLAGRVALLSRNLTNISAAGRRFMTNKTSGFSSKTTTVPFLFGATLGIGSVLGGLHIVKKFNVGNINSGVFTQSLHAAKKVNLE
jgi:hypothetical protein